MQNNKKQYTDSNKHGVADAFNIHGGSEIVWKFE